MYDPHANVDYNEEMELMSKGTLVKARLPDRAPPNVSWYWFMVGNCSACRHFTNVVGRPRCLDPKISDEEFLNTYSRTNTCPQFEVGVEDAMAADFVDNLDVMKAVGLVKGKPSQKVVVIHDSPWSLDLAIRAHRESSVFLDMARHADYIARGGSNDPSRGEYVDLSDDLERPEPAAAAAEGNE